jgi:hypothetical protein
MVMQSCAMVTDKYYQNVQITTWNIFGIIHHNSYYISKIQFGRIIYYEESINYIYNENNIII